MRLVLPTALLLIAGCRKEGTPEDPPRWVDASDESSTRCAVHSDHHVECWVTYAPNDASESPDLEAVDVELGDGFGCVITPEATVECWRRTSNANDNRAIDVLDNKPELEDVVALSADLNRICAIHGDHELTCWGETDPNESQWVVTDAPQGGSWRAVELRGSGCALDTDDRLTCWGGGNPVGPDHDALTNDLTPDRSFATVHRVRTTACGLTTDRQEILCWNPAIWLPIIPELNKPVLDFALFPESSICILYIDSTVECTTNPNDTNWSVSELMSGMEPRARWVRSSEGYNHNFCVGELDGDLTCPEIRSADISYDHLTP